MEKYEKEICRSATQMFFSSRKLLQVSGGAVVSRGGSVDPLIVNLSINAAWLDIYGVGVTASDVYVRPRLLGASF